MLLVVQQVVVSVQVQLQTQVQTHLIFQMGWSELATFIGVLTYEDVTNVDSIGIVTARGGVRIGTGGTVGPVGSGIVTLW